MIHQIKTIGILGGGPMGRMTALAAFRLGVRVCAYTEVEDTPIAQIVPFTFVGQYADRQKLQAFAECVDVITYEGIDIPVESIRFLQKFKPVYPDDHALNTAQNRIREKTFLNAIGLPTVRWAAIYRAGDIATAMEDMAFESAFLKPVQPVPEGKTFIPIGRNEEPKAAWRILGESEALLEENVDCACEVSVIIARDLVAQVALYGPVLNEWENGTLRKSTIPAPIPPDIADKARHLTHALAEAIGLVGVLCVDFFITKDGNLLVNSFSPHPHISGLWTIDACTCSQFEQQVRTVCGLLVGAPNRMADAVTINLAGEHIKTVKKYMEQPNANIHLYGVAEARPGRRMGHITLLNPASETGPIPHTEEMLSSVK